MLADQQDAAVEASAPLIEPEDRTGESVGTVWKSNSYYIVLYHWTSEFVLECLVLEEQRNCFGSHLTFCGGAAEDQRRSN